MRLLISLAVAILLAAAIITGCSNNNQPANVAVKSSNSSPSNLPAAPPDNVRRVTITEARDALNQSKAVIVDVRGDAMYNQEHIKGSLDIPEGQIVSRAGELPKDKLIILYCS